LWPLYLALGATGMLVAYSYAKFGLIGAIALAAAALLFRQLAGQYVDRTLESVRTLRLANEQLEHQAFHDPLTSLANRTLFAERLERAMVRSGEGSIAVLFLDLDDFKSINDTLGHGAGDALLLAATGRFRECARREDTIARLGGDEFTILLEDMRDPSDAARMAERIGEALSRPFELAGQQVVVSASIGIALDTDRSHKPDDLLREADLAMYRAKSGGKARYEIFDTGLGTRAMERLELETDLRHAAEHEQLVLHYQPVVDLATGRMDAVEALLRWQHPRRGLLEPLEFMAVAEQSGIVLDLGRWGLYQACRDAAAWQAERPGLVVQVNLSPLELQRSALVDFVAQALADTGLAAGYLRLEVPESFCSIAANGDAIAGVLDNLQELGVRIALDDVGDGVSSLTWLSRSPVDTLKIGASAADSPALVRASVALAAALGMTVTAQGVEGADQAVRMAALGCRHAQGELYGAPQTAADIADPSRTRVVARAA
jgi:diguanylate cyclase (GGDEF)-like protein